MFLTTLHYLALQFTVIAGLKIHIYIYGCACWHYRQIRCPEWSLLPHSFMCFQLVLILPGYFCLFLFFHAQYASAALVTGLRVKKKGGKQIVTCSKNSSPVDGPSLWGCFGVGHAAIYTYWRACEEVQVLHPACLDP